MASQASDGAWLAAFKSRNPSNGSLVFATKPSSVNVLWKRLRKVGIVMLRSDPEIPG